METKVLIACHKEVEVSKDDLYLPLQVGAFQKESIGFQRDDEGENISDLNPYYSELTGLYWAWKNTNYDYLGLCHYRRYFSTNPKKKGFDGVLELEEAESLFTHFKVILPKKRKYYVETLYSHYANTMNETHLIETRKIIEQNNPEYLDIYDETLKQTSGYMFNMFIMPREYVDAYCAWLFPILEELLKRIGKDGTDFENRYCGRVAERLFNVWLNKQIKDKIVLPSEIYELPYIYLGKVNYYKKAKGFISAKLFKKKYTDSF